jgi:hypothetical protein
MALGYAVPDLYLAPEKNSSSLSTQKSATSLQDAY